MLPYTADVMYAWAPGRDDGEVGERRRPHHMGVVAVGRSGLRTIAAAVKERRKLKKPLKDGASSLIVNVAPNLRVTCPT